MNRRLEWPDLVGVTLGLIAVVMVELVFPLTRSAQAWIRVITMAVALMPFIASLMLFNRRSGTDARKAALFTVRIIALAAVAAVLLFIIGIPCKGIWPLITACLVWVTYCLFFERVLS